MFFELLSPPGRPAVATVFLHERTSRRMARRLVAVEAARNSRDIGTYLVVYVVTPGSLTAYPGYDANHQRFLLYQPSSLPDAGPVRLYAGQVDPMDAARFTIRCVVNGREVGLITGYLTDAGGVVLEAPAGSGLMLYEEGQHRP